MAMYQGKRTDLIQDKHQKRDVLYNLIIGEKKSYREVARILGVHHKTIKIWAMKFGIKSTKRIGWPKVERKNNFDDNYFERIDTPNKAYFLGLLLTDGNVRRKKFSYLVSLRLKDREVIDYLIKEIKYTGQVQKGKLPGVDLVSEKMFSDLNKWGVVPRKSKIIQFPSNIREELYPDLLRGIIDGDGGFYGKKDRKSGGLYIVSGSRKFLVGASKIISKLTRWKRKKVYRKKDGSYQIRYGKIATRRLIQLLYRKKNAPFIKRKYHKAMVLAEMKA